MVQEDRNSGDAKDLEALALADLVGTNLSYPSGDSSEGGAPDVTDPVIAVAQEVIQALSSYPESPQASQRFFDAILQLTQCQVASINAIDESADLVRTVLFATTLNISREPDDSWPLSGSLVEQRLKIGGPHIRNLQDQGAGFIGSRKYLDAGIRSTLFAPIVYRGKTIGAFFLRAQAVDALRAEDLSKISHLCALIGPALAATLRYLDSRREQQFAQALNRVSQSLNATLDSSQVLDSICRECGQLLRVSHVAFYEVEGEELIRRLGWESSDSSVDAAAAGTGEGRQSLLEPVTGLAPRVARTGLAEIVNDVSEVPPGALDAELMRTGLNSVMAVPLLESQRVSGVLLMAHAGTERRFTSESLALAETFASHAAVALQNARLHEASRSYAAQIDLVDEVARIITTTLNIDEVYEQFVREVEKLVRFDRMNIILADYETDNLVFKYVYDRGPANHRAGDREPMANTQTERVISTGRAVIRGDISANPIFANEHRHVQHELLSSIGVPLFAKGKILGVLVLRVREPNAYGSREQAILERLASQIAPAIENAELYQSLQESTQEIALVDEVARIITTTLNIDEVYEQFSQELKKLVDFDRIYINSLVPGADAYIIKYPVGGNHLDVRSGDLVPLAGSQTEQVVFSGESVVRDDISTDIRYVNDHKHVAAGLYSSIGVPLIAKGIVVGIMVLRNHRVGAFGPREKVILERLASQIAPAIENARLYQDLQVSSEEMAVVDEVAGIITATLDIDQVYEQFVQEVKKLVDFDRININILEPGTDAFLIKYFHGVSLGGRSRGDTVPLEGTLTHQLMEREQGRSLDAKALATMEKIEEGCRAIGLHSATAVLLKSKGSVIGSLVLRRRQEEAFAPREQVILERLASQIAPAIENARLYHDLQTSSEEMAVVDGVAGIITATLDIDEVYERFGQELKKLVDFDRIGINVIDLAAGVSRFKYASGGIEGKRQVGDEVPLAGTRTELMLNTRQPVIWPNPNSSLEAGDDDLIAWGIQSTILVPLIAKGRVIGTLALRSSRAWAYGDRERTILERLANQIAPAVENAGLYDTTRSEQRRVTDALAQLEASQEALRESEEKYRTLFEESRDAIYIRDGEGRFVDVNQATVDLFGYTRTELMAMNIVDLCDDPESRVEFQEKIEKSESVRDLETRFRRKDGAGLECLLSATVRRGGDGGFLGYQGIIHDVTERRQLEAQFLQSQKMESLGRLAGGIAHDFNNLLGGILGFSSLLRSKLEPSSETYEFAQIIETATQRGSHLTRQLLTAARRGPFEAEPMDLNQTTQEVVQIFSRTLADDITLVFQPQPDLPLIHGDANQLQQVLMNLGINAADAMPNGGTLTISNQSVYLGEDFCRQHISLDPGQYIQLMVSDTGEGVREEDRSRIFEPFFTTKESGKGTGLGLSVVYGIVENHRGVVEVQSQKGQGSTFTVYLPVLRISLER